eukprot:SAG31_NODE_19502_length_600_cov_0.634731_1_plen_117_part_10
MKKADESRTDDAEPRVSQPDATQSMMAAGTFVESRPAALVAVLADRYVSISRTISKHLRISQNISPPIGGGSTQLETDDTPRHVGKPMPMAPPLPAAKSATVRMNLSLAAGEGCYFL